MSRSEELWERIKTKISEEELISDEEIASIENRVLSNKVSEEDWSAAVLNSMGKEDENGQQ